MATVAPSPVAGSTTAPGQDRVIGDRFVATCVLLLAALLVVMQVAAGELIPPVAVPAVIYAALGGALLRWRPKWLLVTAAALPILHLVASIPFFAAAIAHPESPASFIPDTLVGVAGVTASIAAVIALRQGPGASRRVLARGAGVVAAGVVVVSLAAAGSVASDQPEAGDVEVQAVRAQYPAAVEVPSGGAALWIDNQDAIRHTLVIDGTGVHVELPGSTAVRTEVDLAPGTYRFFCDVPGHDGMEGELTVS